MKPFAYVNAANEKEALAALGPERGKFLPMAGGMDLLALMKDYVAQPERLVNVKNLDKTIAKTSDGGLRIGAAVTIADLAVHPDVTRMYPRSCRRPLKSARRRSVTRERSAATSTSARAAGTTATKSSPCLKKGGSRCFAVDGENQYHAIFGSGPCHIVQPSSLAVPAVALGAKMRVIGPAGERTVDAEQYFVMPDRNLFGETVLEPNELMTHLILPAPGGVKSAMYEVRFKQSHDWPLAAATAALDMRGSTVRGARIVIGSVAPIPWRAAGAEKVLAGKAMTEQVAMEAADAAVQGAKAMSQNAYKIQVARTAVKRAIMLAAGLKGNWA